MRLPELLRSIDGLSYGQRVRLLADQAPQLVSLLDELGRGTAFERVLGLQIAEVTREAPYVSRMLRDPDPAVQSRALAAVARGVPVADDDLRIVYDDAPAALRSKLVALVRRQRREHLAVRLIDEHRARWGDVAATGLLAASDHATVARLLPELAYCVTPGGWRQLAKHHPDEVLAFARQTLPANDEWWQGVGHGVTASLEHAPDAVLELIKQAVPAHDLPSAVLDIIGPLTDRDPAGVLDLLLAPDRRGVVTRALTPAFRRRLHRYSDDELITLGRVLWPQLATFLDALEPSRRAVIFAAVTQYVDLGQAQLSTELLQALPHAVRAEQTRRMLALPVITEDAWWRRSIASHLPFDDAFALLEGDVSDPDAAVRSSVYQGVIQSAGYGRRPEQVVQAVTWVAGRIRNEQDTVRLNAVQAVAELPPTLLTDAMTESLDTLLTDVLAARDASWATRHAMTQVAENAVVQGVLANRTALLDWGLQAHARLSENRGRIDLDPLVDRLPRGREADVYEALRPAIEAAAKRDEFSLAFTVAAALGRRDWTTGHLESVLEQAVWLDQEHTSEQACRYWLEPPRTRYERLRQIVDRDVTMARWHPVWWLVTEHYTDLLDPVLAAADRIRRFDRSSTSWQVPDYALRRWLPRQQARYAELLVEAARDDRMHTWYRALAVRTLGRVPVAGRAALDEFLGSTDVLLQEAALAALAWTERPDLAMPLLLAHAGDDRARVAVYAASRAARYVRPSLLPGLLQPVLTGARVKVTSRKEAVRLLGELRAPGASAVLTEAWAGAHRDVRAAIARTVSQYLLYDPAAWAVLEQAVHDSPATATALTVRRAYDVPVGYRARYADLLIAVTTRSEPEVVGPALLALRGWARYNPAATRVCADFINRLSLRSRVWRDAITALVSFVATDAPAGLDDVVDVARLLVRSEANPALPNALPERDHPARQRLTYLVSQLSAQFSRRSAEDRRYLRLVADELVGSDFLELRLELLVHSQSAIELRDLVGDDPLAALRAAELVSARLSGTESTWTPAELLPVAESLVHSPDLASGLLAYVLVSAAAPRSGWSTEWRELLIALRNHPSPAVRRRALNLTTATE